MDIQHLCRPLFRPAEELSRSPHRPRARKRSPGCPLRLVLGCLLILAAGLAGGPANAAQQYSQNLNFQTSNQGMWPAGPQYVASWSQEYSASWNNSSSGGSFYDLSGPSVTLGDCDISCSTIPGISLGKFGAKGSASTSGEIGLRPSVTVTTRRSILPVSTRPSGSWMPTSSSI
jgi:hypothetical protein